MSERPPGVPPPRRVFLALALLGLLALAPDLAVAPRYKSWDYGPHHALTRALAGGLAAGHLPRYAIGVSTGDSPYELYPLPTYLTAAAAALLAGAPENIPAVLLLLGACCHVVIAALVARLAARFAPLPLAILLGLAAFLDAGSFESGAAESILEAGLLAGALAQCLLLAALDQALEVMRRGPSRRRVLGLQALVGLAAAAHPSSLLFFAALLPALLLSAAVGRGLRPRNVLLAALHVAIGLLLSSFAWAPFAARVLRYGLHFAYPAPPALVALREFARLTWPPTSFPPLLALGFAGVLLAPIRRRGAQLVVALLALALLAAFSELPHRLWFDWLPHTLARVQSFRLLTLARPLLLVAAAVPLAAAWRYVRSRSALLGLSFPAGALALGLLLALLATVGGSRALPGGRGALRSLIASQVEDPAGFEGLVAWARARQREASPERLARLMWAGSDNAVYHLAAEAGMPAFYVGDGVGLLLRERIEDASPESLRRFDVRFVARRGEPPGRGDPASEQRFGSYYVRELAEWDGQLARIERGHGKLRVSALADERIEVALEDTSEPALVALGLGFYPRWRASAGGAPVPVYAAPATAQGSVRILAAWLRPGTTVFTADAALPEDGLGLGSSALGLALAAATLATAAAPRRLRRRALRALPPGHLRTFAAAVLLALMAAGVALAGMRREHEPALRLVPGWRPLAEVEARSAEGAWTPCGFDAIFRDFDCGGLGRIGDGTAFAIRDHPSSTPFLTPGVVARPAQNRVEYRIRLTRRLSGRYWAAGWGPGGATLRCGESVLELSRRRQTLELAEPQPGAAACELLLRTRGGAQHGATVVAAGAIDLDRTSDVPWAPDAPPPPAR